MDFNFTQIRSFDKSQHNGFEELVCQVAHLEEPKNKKNFTRKDGSGGDAGLECYWTLEDGTEIGWQVKYFPEGMNPSRWAKLDESFNTAIEKHSRLTKFIVALPIDKTDSRKTNKGKKTISVEDEWRKRLIKWSKSALEKGREMEFEFWGKFEISSLLMKDDPRYSGRAFYWFNEPLLNSELYRKLALNTESLLGEKYDELLHIDLPIAKKFDGLGITAHWWEALKKVISKLEDEKGSFFRTFSNPKKPILDLKVLKSLQVQLNDFSKSAWEYIHEGDFWGLMNASDAHLGMLCDFESQLNDLEHDPFSKENDSGYIFRSFFRALKAVDVFIKSDATNAARVKAVLVTGEGGMGKSHLFCDLSLKRIEENLPTLFLLASHYSGGDPIDFIKRSLDLEQYRDGQVLGALDAAGEASRARTMIVLDAINEGPYRGDWYDHLGKFVKTLDSYPNICLLMSCRSTFVSHIVPTDLPKDSLLEFEHFGFRGFEHRAAEKYLAKHGIAKPSAPIMAPEFTNPLFLKTCCKALKVNKATSFPKSIKGIVNLFDFYLESVEKEIARRKQYIVQERIVEKCLKSLADALFPDQLEGVPVNQARSLINELDPNRHMGDSLFDELMREGLLSDDISYRNDSRGYPIIRFTFERFSDHFMAERLTDDCAEESILNLFSPEEPLGKLIQNRQIFFLLGILEATSLLIAERFGIEMEDLVSNGSKLDKHYLDQIFKKTIIWRSGSSISDRTLELLNQLQGYEEPGLDILLKLSTEPDHPWNADFLHSNLTRLTSSTRDSQWSAYVAKWDYEEDEETEESIIRTLIRWAYSGHINESEPERARLCAVTLTWFLTTPNRKVRDQSTMSLVRLLSCFPQFLASWLKKFSSVDDLYLLERVYAITYGVLCAVQDMEILQNVSTIVFDLIFRDQKPIPHLLLRDYARGSLELALYHGMLMKDISPQLFRPPYNSHWPLEIPTEGELDLIAGKAMKSEVRNSLMGYVGDFGHYTMQSVDNWSSTPVHIIKGQTGQELKAEFAEKYLQGDLKRVFLSSSTIAFEEGLENHRVKLWHDLMKEGVEGVAEQVRKKQNEIQKMEEEFNDLIRDTLKPNEIEYFNWLVKQSNSSIPEYNRIWAQRWVCKRVYDLGWSDELFDAFDRLCSRRKDGPLANGHMERMGKKYQWIAFHEFLALQSDNLKWIERSYGSEQDTAYNGPWQIGRRDIDPTLWIRKNGEGSYYNEKEVWWQPYIFNIDHLTSIETQTKFIWSKSEMPDFTKTLIVREPQNGPQWTVLKGRWHQKQERIEEKNAPKLDGWFRVNAVIVDKNDVEKLTESLKGKYLTSPNIVRAPETGSQVFWGEYPWHSSMDNETGWQSTEDFHDDLFCVDHLIPFSKYTWEENSTDYSIDDSLSFYLPAKELISEMKLKKSGQRLGGWVDSSETLTFLDPSLTEEGVSFALINSEKLEEWLVTHNREIVWIVGGEKMLFASMPRQFYGRLSYSGVYRMKDGKINGTLWFEEEEPVDL